MQRNVEESAFEYVAVRLRSCVEAILNGGLRGFEFRGFRIFGEDIDNLVAQSGNLAFKGIRIFKSRLVQLRLADISDGFRPRVVVVGFQFYADCLYIGESGVGMESENGADQNPRGYDEDAEDCPQFKFTDRFQAYSSSSSSLTKRKYLYLFFDAESII